MKYYVCYKNRRILGPLTKEEAVQQLFELRGAFKHLYVLIVDENGKTVGRIGRKR